MKHSEDTWRRAWLIDDQVGEDPVRRFQAFAFQQVKPNGVDVENGIFGKLKRFRRCFTGPDLNPLAPIYV